jgi:hypothetical protein
VECIGAWLGNSVYLETTLGTRPGWLLVQITGMTLHLEKVEQGSDKARRAVAGKARSSFELRYLLQGLPVNLIEWET